MTSPRFLTVDQVLEIHEDQIARYGGSPGVRDKGLLESAVAAPTAALSNLVIEVASGNANREAVVKYLESHAEP